MAERSVLDQMFDQAVLTDLVVGPVETQMEAAPTLGSQIAPVNPIQARAARIQVSKLHAVGIGQYKAPNATPPLMDITGREREEHLIELVLLEEMHRIDSERYMRLQSTDENIRNSELRSLVEIGQILQLRNERLTERMRWEAFSGQLVANYQVNGDSGMVSTLTIDYPLPVGNKPTASPLWSNTSTSDPVADLKAWQKQVADESGFYGTRIHMSTDAWELVINNDNLKTYFNIPTGQPFIPTEADVLSLLRAGTQIVITDAGYRDESVGASVAASDHTRYLPLNKVLVTTEYSIDGQNIADTLDGQVEVSTGYNTTAILQGAQSELILDHMSKNRFLRQASARIPRLLVPEAFLYATVS
jgi:hypothetical protein